MVDALDAGAAMQAVLADRAPVAPHGGVELERHAARVAREQCAALERHLTEFGRQPARAEPVRGLVEVLLLADLVAERVAERLAGLAQHDRMVIALLDAAQVERVLGLLGREQPEAVRIERARGGEIRDPEHHMARTQDVERRVEDGGLERHGL